MFFTIEIALKNIFFKIHFYMCKYPKNVLFLTVFFLTFVT
jgi:hypothetical protein